MYFFEKIMATAKWVINTIETIILGFWGLTIIDLIPLFQVGLLSDIDNTIKAVMAIIGAIYLIVQLPYKISNLSHKKKMNNLDRQIKEAELRKIIEEDERSGN